MNLASVFSAVAHKQLVRVDLPKLGSNQHELNGVTALKEFFGSAEPTRGTLSWYYFADDQEPIQEEGDFTFYDARARSAGRTKRSEWRFYYYGEFLACANIGDWFFLARSQSGRLFGLVFQQGSAWVRAAQALFGVQTTKTLFDLMSREALDSQQLELLRRQVLAKLNLEVSVPARPTDEELMVAKYVRTFPTTKEMSALARSQVEVDMQRPDEVLVRWLEREEELFRALENVIISERLKAGFESVDEFIAYSLSVQNRRKSRMGHALQNHLAEIFTQQGLQFTAQARTEENNRPDFIFPGEAQYHDAAFDAALLMMLGVKSTSKDRWRQVLTEADRIRQKHLCTLEPGISTKQTDEMARQELTLVVPATLHETYTQDQREWLLSVGNFIQFARKKEKHES